MKFDFQRSSGRAGRAPIRVWVGQGWTRRQALNRAKPELPRGFDYRAFSYDPVKGVAVFG